MHWKNFAQPTQKRKKGVGGVKYCDSVFYDVFAGYCGNDINIVPVLIWSHNMERAMNPTSYFGFYSDKNSYDRFFPSGILPKTIFRRIDGIFMDDSYNPINPEFLLNKLDDSGFCRVIIKPSVNTSGGKGIMLAEKLENEWIVDGVKVDTRFLTDKLGKNYIVQEALKQSENLSYYGKTSINTLRIAVYRSVKTEKLIVLSGVLRIGKDGEIKDNACSGGRFVKINPDGTLGDTTFDQYGTRTKVFNGVDYSTATRKIPNFEAVIAFAKEVSRHIVGQRIIALDIAIDNNEACRLIEFNCETYCLWLPQFTGVPAFGKYTDEIIEYCKNHPPKELNIGGI